MDSGWIPLIIFFARIADVSLGTVRIVFVSKGYRLRAALLGFVEILIWITVVAEVLSNLDNWVNYIAYAGGFASGTYIGMVVEEKLKVGIQVFRIITHKPIEPLLQTLQAQSFRYTVLDAKGGFGGVKIVFLVAKRKHVPRIVSMIHAFDSKAFYSIEDVKHTSTDSQSPDGFPSNRHAALRWLSWRKSM